ncbi:MAG TPA: BON domain-containing protein [Parachlamydiaceae bacterium]|nr:BON domain-containing protein [Parachlamydiaceae bacterium]
MKNIFIFSAIFLSSLSLNSYAAIEVQVDQIKSTEEAVPSSTIKNGQIPTNGQIPENGKNPTAPKPVEVLPEDQRQAEPFIKDHDLSKAIYDAIRSDRLFANDSKLTIQVTVFNGKVTLSGAVKTQAEKERAEFLATQVNNLKKVTNDIKVIQ